MFPPPEKGLFGTGVREPKISQAPALNISGCLQSLQGQETASSIDRRAPLLGRVFLGAFLNQTGSLPLQLRCSVSANHAPPTPSSQRLGPAGESSTRSIPPLPPPPTPSPPSPPRPRLRQRPCKGTLKGFRGHLIPETFPKVEEDVEEVA